VGELFKVFPQLEVSGIFDFIFSRLTAGNAITPTTLSGLGIIRSLLTAAGGVEAMGGEGSLVSKQQLEGRAGSLLLRRETISFGVVDKVNPTASKALRKLLLCEDIDSEEHANIGVALLLRLSQLNAQLELDNASGWSNVMLLARVYDSTHFVLMLLLDFISSPRDWDTADACNAVRQTYARNLPAFSTLQNKMDGFGVSVSLSWSLYRPCIRAAMIEEREELEKREQEEANIMYDKIGEGDKEAFILESEHGTNGK
jgi:hypothetical protein